MGTFNDAVLSVIDGNSVKALGLAWKSVINDKDTTNDYLAKDYHDQAEKIRANYGYSGGADGSNFVTLAQVVTPVATTTTTKVDGVVSQTPVSDEFFGNVPTGVTQVTNAMQGVDINKMIAVGSGFLFLVIIGNFLTKKRR